MTSESSSEGAVGCTEASPRNIGHPQFILSSERDKLKDQFILKVIDTQFLTNQSNSRKMLKGNQRTPFMNHTMRNFNSALASQKISKQ